MGLHSIKIDNSKSSAIKSGKWSNPGAKLYDTLLDSFYSKGDIPIGAKELDKAIKEGSYLEWYDFIKEAYMVAPIKNIKNSPYGRTPFSRSGCKYPHHVVKGDKLVLSLPGLRSAYMCARNQGILVDKNDGNNKIVKHFNRHFDELGVNVVWKHGDLYFEDKETKKFVEYIDDPLDSLDDIFNEYISFVENVYTEESNNSFNENESIKAFKNRWNYNEMSSTITYDGRIFFIDLDTNSSRINNGVKANYNKPLACEIVKYIGGKKVYGIMVNKLFWKFEPDEQDAVILHEIGHIVCQHSPKPYPKTIKEFIERIKKAIQRLIARIRMTKYASGIHGNSWKELEADMYAANRIDPEIMKSMLRKMYSSKFTNLRKEAENTILENEKYFKNMYNAEMMVKKNKIPYDEWIQKKIDEMVSNYEKKKTIIFDNMSGYKNKDADQRLRALDDMKLLNNKYFKKESVDEIIESNFNYIYSVIMEHTGINLFDDLHEFDDVLGYDSFNESKMSNEALVFSKSNIGNTPKELLYWMKENISYDNTISGWKFRTPSETFIDRKGNCHDQALFESLLLNSMNIVNNRLFFIEFKDSDPIGGSTHTFTWFRKGGPGYSDFKEPASDKQYKGPYEYYWFENAWENYRGIHGPFNDLKELKDYVFKCYKEDNDINQGKYDGIMFGNPYKCRCGMSLGEYVESCDIDDNEEYRINDKYDPPLEYDKLPQHLKDDPVYAWRAKSGIELIHKEPSRDELERIWKNWQLMSDEQKKISDEKSIELFNMTNEEHYKTLINEYMSESRKLSCDDYKCRKCNSILKGDDIHDVPKKDYEHAMSEFPNWDGRYGHLGSIVCPNCGEYNYIIYEGESVNLQSQIHELLSWIENAVYNEEWYYDNDKVFSNRDMDITNTVSNSDFLSGYYRITFNGLNIIDAIKSKLHDDLDLYMSTDNFNWLPNPEQVHTEGSYYFFTKIGFIMFNNKLSSIVNKYLEYSDIKYEYYRFDTRNVLYNDEFQMITNDSNISTILESPMEVAYGNIKYFARKIGNIRDIIDNNNTIESFIQWMDNISYGWMLRGGSKYYDDNPEIFNELYYLQSPYQTIRSGVGVCWDQVELERLWFTRHKIKHSTIYIEIIDNKNNPSHTFLIYENNNKYYWFENAWNKFKGIHEYESITECISDVINKHRSQYNDTKSKVIAMKYKKPRFGINCTEFIAHCKNGRKFMSYTSNESLQNESFSYDIIDIDSIIDDESFMEASHGKLKFDFREVFDYDTGHSLKIVYSLDNIKVTDVGGHYLNDNKYIDNELKNQDKLKDYIQKNIKYKGSMDHQSTGQKVVAIVDRVTNKNLQKARTIGPYAPGVKKFNMETNFRELSIPYIILKKIHNAYNKRGKEFIDANVYELEVGKIDNSISFKSTKWFDQNMIGMMRDGEMVPGNNMNKMRTTSEHINIGRGAKMDDINPDYPIELDPESEYFHPSKRDKKRFARMEEEFRKGKREEWNRKYANESTMFTESDKNGTNRKKLYQAFIQFAKQHNPHNTFGNISDWKAFTEKNPFVPYEMRYFYRIANPILCVLEGNLVFFQVSELQRLNNDNPNLDDMIVFAATETDVRIFNCNDKKVYRGEFENDNTLVVKELLGLTFDEYLQNMIGQGDILNS